MAIFLFLVFIQSTIPEKFLGLVNKSILDITLFVPPANFDYQTNSHQIGINGEITEIKEYFIKLKKEIEKKTSNSLNVLYLSTNQISFNSELDDDEFISVKDDLTINYIGGTLNIIIHENCQATINLGKMNIINLNMFGDGELKLINEEHSTIYINGVININSDQIIHVNNNVKSIQIQQVNIAQNCEFYGFNDDDKKMINITIKNLNLLENSKVNFSCVEVTDTLLIKQTATAFFDETDNIENSTLIIEMVYYQNDLIPMISGKLSKPPNQIKILHESEENIKNLENEYLIFDGKFDCNEWIDKILINDSCINKVRCVNSNINDFHMMSIDSNRTFISFLKRKNVTQIKTVYDYYFPKRIITLLTFLALDVLIYIAIVIMEIIYIHR